MRLTNTSPANELRGPKYSVEERRASTRFPLDAEVRYKLFHEGLVTSGSGRTVNMGSGGMLLTTEDRLPVGVKIEVAVNWPVLLDGGCRLKFVGSGVVLRSDQQRAAVRIGRHEFHTRASRSN
jgi:hypothetical protein